MRLIDADALLSELGECPYNWTDTEREVQEVNDWEMFRNMIDNAPTVQAKGGLIRKQDALDILDDFEADIEVGKRDSYKTNREKLLSLPSAKSTGDLISIQMAIEHWGRSSGNLTNDQIAELQREIESLPSADAVQIPIKLEKRYPQSRDEDITDAFMRGYLAGRSSADRPTGEWVNEDGTPSKASYSVYCSRCGQWSEYRGFFCLWCGAKMGGTK